MPVKKWMEPRGILTEATFNRDFLTKLVPAIESELSNRSDSWGQMRPYETSLLSAFRAAFEGAAPNRTSKDTFYRWANAYAGNSIPEFVFRFEELVYETLNGGFEQWASRRSTPLGDAYELAELMDEWGWAGSSAGKALDMIVDALENVENPWEIRDKQEESKFIAKGWIKSLNQSLEDIKSDWEKSGIADWEAYAEARDPGEDRYGNFNDNTAIGRFLNMLNEFMEEIDGDGGRYRHSFDIIFDKYGHPEIEVDRATYRYIEELVHEKIEESLNEEGDWERTLEVVEFNEDAFDSDTLKDLERWLRRQMPMSESKMERALLLTEASEKKKQWAMTQFGKKLVAAFSEDPSFAKELPAELQGEPKSEQEKAALDQQKLKWLVDQLAATDQDPKGKYFVWLVRLYDGKTFKFEDKYKAAEAFNDIRELGLDRRRMPDGKPFDIMRYKTIQELWDVVDKLKLAGGTTSRKEERTKEAEEAYKGARIIADDDRHMFLEVLDNGHGKKAAIYFGKNTRWCTAGTSYNYYDSYKDNLYILIDKTESPPRKYQFHFGKYPS